MRHARSIRHLHLQHRLPHLNSIDSLEPAVAGNLGAVHKRPGRTAQIGNNELIHLPPDPRVPPRDATVKIQFQKHIIRTGATNHDLLLREIKHGSLTPVFAGDLHSIQPRNDNAAAEYCARACNIFRSTSSNSSSTSGLSTQITPITRSSQMIGA